MTLAISNIIWPFGELAAFAVDQRRYLEVLWIGDLVLGDEIGVGRRRRVEVLAHRHDAALHLLHLDIAHADVVHHGVSRYHIEITVGRDVFASLVTTHGSAS